MKRILQVVVFLCFVLAVSAPDSARADVAPPGRPPGSNPEPGAELTQVRMVAETVVLDVLANTPQGSFAQAKVAADFTMRNLGTASESMGVRFPLGSNNGFGEVTEIKNVSVEVDGRPVVTRRIVQDDPVWGGDPVPWAEFDVTFPPNQDVNIRVLYLLDGTGEYPFVSFSYIFHTGAGWKDSIGSADLIVRLPYEATTQNVIFEDEIGWSRTTAGGVIRGQEIRWRFDNFEPDQSNDFQLSLVMPSAWQKVLKERAAVQANPNDGEAWGRLGKLYKEIFFYRRDFRHDSGGQELYALSVSAYETCLSLLPDDAQWHAGFADLLALHAYYENFGNNDPVPEKIRALKEIDQALKLDPNDPKVKEIAEKIYFLFGDVVLQTGNTESGYVFYWLTATPDLPTPQPAPVEPTVAPSATEAPLPTPTTVPANEATPAPVPTPVTASNPLCGSALLLPLGLVLLARRRTIVRG